MSNHDSTVLKDDGTGTDLWTCWLSLGGDRVATLFCICVHAMIRFGRVVEEVRWEVWIRVVEMMILIELRYDEAWSSACGLSNSIHSNRIDI